MAEFEAIFHATQLELLLPDHSAFAGSSGSQTPRRDAAWWRELQRHRSRDVAFFDERLSYFFALHIPHRALGSGSRHGYSGAQDELKRFLAYLQLTLTASFLPSLPKRDALQTPTPTRGAFPPSIGPKSANNLFVPETPSNPSPGGVSDPSTPMPFPAMRESEDDYAQVQGVTVWEGDVGPMAADSNKLPGASSAAGDVSREGEFRWIIEGDDGWDVVFQGQAPVAYVRTPIQNPMLGLTASITLRDTPARRRADGPSHKKSMSIESVASEATFKDDIGEEEEYELQAEDRIGQMEEVDLLGGLSGGVMPATRLGQSAIHDLSIPPPSPLSALPLSAQTPALTSASASSTPASAHSAHSQSSRDRAPLPTPLAMLGNTLRKSYRRVLSLSPGLRVRMRNLVLPQLVDHTSPGRGGGAEDQDDGEKQVVLCVEIENPPEDAEHSWVIEGVGVDIGGKGGKATAELACDPSSGREGQTETFPIQLAPVEQYNLLYAVSIASSSDPLEAGPDDAQAQAILRHLGTGELQRPVAITVNAHPLRRLDDPVNGGSEAIQPAETFISRWNCTLDLAGYYASSQSAASINPRAPMLAPAMQPVPAGAKKGSGRYTGRPPHLASLAFNQIAGDKRYSLASLLQGDTPSDVPSSGGSSARPLMPSQIVNQGQGRQPMSRQFSAAGIGMRDQKASDGLLVSAKLLADHRGAGGEAEDLKALDEFTVEIFVQNISETVRRFRLSVPRPGDMGGRAGSIASPAVIPLENDVRCGPLLPGASLAARMRFIAMRDGVHRIDRLRVIGVGSEDVLDHVISPVLNIVVGSR